MKRQKECFDSKEIAHIWAHRSAPHGRCTSNMRFDGDTFYSYNTAIGKLVKNKAGEECALLNSHHFSSTTSGHQGNVRSAVNHLTTFMGDFGGYGEGMNLKPSDVVRHYISAAKGSAKTKHKLQRIESRARAHAKSLLDEAGRAAVFFSLSQTKINAELDKSEPKLKEDYKILEEYEAKSLAAREKRDTARREKWERRNALEKARFEEQLTAFLADHKCPTPSRWEVERQCPEKLSEYDQQVVAAEINAIKDWREGHDVRVPSFPVMLRVEMEEIENPENPPNEKERREIVTSMGARIPYMAGKRTFEFASKLKAKGWHRNGEQFQVGHYQLDAINENEIVAGCHRITWEEIDRLATQEGWIK